MWIYNTTSLAVSHDIYIPTWLGYLKRTKYCTATEFRSFYKYDFSKLLTLANSLVEIINNNTMGAYTEPRDRCSNKLCMISVFVFIF